MSNKTFIQTAVKQQNDIPFVKGVDGTTVNIVGKMSITIRVGGLDLNQNFYILERMNHSVIRGTDFLRSNEVKIDFGKMEMSLAADKVKIGQGNSSGRQLCHNSSKAPNIHTSNHEYTPI